jgi:hypothetical protein
MSNMNDLTEDCIKVCRNDRCSRFKTLVATTDKRCYMCGSKLRKPSTDEMRDDDSPVLIESNSTPVHMPPSFRPDQRLLIDNPEEDDVPGVFSATANGEHCDITKECPVATTPSLRIPYSTYQAWTFLAHMFDVEWIAYHKGAMEDNNYTLEEGMVFPLQRAREAHVQAESKGELEGMIAAIHSHHSMSAYFSQEDKEHWNMPVELVINNKGELAANVRVKLDCLRWARVKPKTILTYTSEQQSLEAQLKAKLIIEPSPPSSYLNQRSAVVVSSSSTTRPHNPGPLDGLMGEKGWHVTQGGLVVMDARAWSHPEAAAEAFKRMMDKQIITTKP